MYEPRRRLPGGSSSDRLARGGDRLGDPALRDQQERQVVPGVAERRRDLDRASARRFGLPPTACAGAAGCPGSTAPAGSRPSSMLRRKARSASSVCAQVLQHVAEVVPDAGDVGRDLDGMAQQAERGRVLAALMLQHAHVVEERRDDPASARAVPRRSSPRRRADRAGDARSPVPAPVPASGSALAPPPPGGRCGREWVSFISRIILRSRDRDKPLAPAVEKARSVRTLGPGGRR